LPVGSLLSFSCHTKQKQKKTNTKKSHLFLQVQQRHLSPHPHNAQAAGPPTDQVSPRLLGFLLRVGGEGRKKSLIPLFPPLRRSRMMLNFRDWISYRLGSSLLSARPFAISGADGGASQADAHGTLRASFTRRVLY
jgi:hypothetical protein